MQMDIFQLNADNLTLAGDISNYVKSGEWDLVGFPNRRHNPAYNGIYYPDVTFTVVINR